MATGRSDFPNQVNNVLGFPFIFRGALDVRATNVNREMKVAAAKALAALAREDIPDSVLRAYRLESLHFGREYIIPKPLDPRVLTHVAPAVARAAMETGVARQSIDLEAYPDQLAQRQGGATSIMRQVHRRARMGSHRKRVVFAEGENPQILRAAGQVLEQGIAEPVLLGRPAVIRERLAELRLDYEPEIILPGASAHRARYSDKLYELRGRKGVTLARARELAVKPNYYGALMVRLGDADAFLSGLGYNYPDVLRPALQVIGTKSEARTISGVYLLIVRNRPYFLSDATVNIETNSELLAEIAINAAEVAETFNVKPRVAMLSYSNFGSTRTPESEKVRRAVDIVRQIRPDLMIDGEMQADTAVVTELVDQHFPFSRVRDANVLVFPNLDAANAAYKLLSRLGGAEAIGPILQGMARPVQVIPTGADVRDIVNITALAVVDALRLERQQMRLNL
jgi:malate dehydrogenase (oxaloacetate-decarboxylating)(NADP+)